MQLMLLLLVLLLTAAMPGWQQKQYLGDDGIVDFDTLRKEQVCVGIVVMVGCRAFLQLLLLWI
jgi:hypothetical protein